MMKNIAKRAKNIPTPAQTAKLQSGRFKNGRPYNSAQSNGAIPTPAENDLRTGLSALTRTPIVRR